MSTLKITISGACGKMGKELVRLAMEDEKFELVGAVEYPGNANIGKDAGEEAGIGPSGIKITDKIPDGTAVVVDFSSPEGTIQRIDECRKARIPIVVGTTGLSKEEEQKMALAGRDIAIVYSPNMSMGVHVLKMLAENAVGLLGEDCDIELLETHHNRKIDAPSGTAIFLAEAMNRTRRGKLIHGRKGRAPREKREIGIHAIRCGDVVGEHKIIFATPSEVIELTHKALSRSIFARGALVAASATPFMDKGVFGMEDALNLLKNK